MNRTSNFYNSIIDQKLEFLGDSIREFHGSHRLPRDGLRNPFRLPGVVAVSFYRTRTSRRLERKMSIRFPEALAAAMHKALPFSDMVSIIGENRHESDRPGRDVMFFAMRKSLLPSFRTELVNYVNESPLTTIARTQWYTDMDRGTVRELIQDMFDCGARAPRKTGNLIWA